MLKGINAQCLLIIPSQQPASYVIAVPDAGMSPESLAARLNEPHSKILNPLIIDRNSTFSGNPRIKMTGQSHREYIYRMAYPVGRHILGYEVQKVLAAVDYFAKATPHLPIRVIGYGEGAIIWQQPIDRNIWSILK